MVTVTESANAPGATYCDHAVRPLLLRCWEGPLPVLGKVPAPAVFRVVTVTLGVSSALRLALYGVGLVQMTEAGDAAVALAAVKTP